MTIDVLQIAAVVPSEGQPNLEVSSIALVVPTTIRALQAHVEQIAIVVPCEGPRGRIEELDTIYKLPCFTPCTPFAFRKI